MIDGEAHWAWLEIDPSTYETIAVLDTGERGSFAEHARDLIPTSDNYLQFVAGAVVGVAASVCSVSAFSMVLTDYHEILTAAKRFTAAVSQVLGGLLQLSDLSKREYSMGLVLMRAPRTTSRRRSRRRSEAERLVRGTAPRYENRSSTSGITASRPSPALYDLRTR